MEVKAIPQIRWSLELVVGYAGVLVTTERRPTRIAVLLDQLESDYHLDVVSGVKKAAGDRARVVVIAGGRLGSDELPEPRNSLYDELERAEVDGFVLLTGCLGNYSGRATLESFVERFAGRPTIGVGVSVAGAASVTVDNEEGVRQLVRHLVEVHGASRIALLRGPRESQESEARTRGFRRALEESGLEWSDRFVVRGGLERTDGTIGVAALLDDRGLRPGTLDAVVCVNDEVALGAIEELHRRGIGVPRPIAVVGFDDELAAEVANPPLSTVKQRAREQGEAAMSSLLVALERAQPPLDRIVEPAVRYRESCGCRLHVVESRSPTSERPRVARTCRLALIEKREAIRTALARAAAGRMSGSHDWEGRLLDALAAQIDSSEGGAFFWEFERLARLQGKNRGHPLVCHDVLSALRSEALACAEVEAGVRPRLEDVFQEARVILARVAAGLAMGHLDATNQQMRVLMQACLEQVGSPDLGALEVILNEHLPLLGIDEFCISRPSALDGELREVVARTRGSRRVGVELTLPRRGLGIDQALARLAMVVVEPLCYAGEDVGLAVFSWGALEPILYEELRVLLAMALYANRRIELTASAPLPATRTISEN